MGAGDREMMCQLLGLTNKAEVLENEEFFRIAWEYQFDTAEMPHSNTITRGASSVLLLARIVSLEPNDDFAMGAPPGAPGAIDEGVPEYCMERRA